jgi:hypothetical protein
VTPSTNNKSPDQGPVLPGAGNIKSLADLKKATTPGDNLLAAGTQLAIFSPSTVNSVVFKNKLWALGATINSSTWWGVWSSSNGGSWSNQTSSNWAPRIYSGVVVYNNKIWQLGGMEVDIGLSSSTVQKSSNGSAWQTVTNTAPWYWNSHSAFVSGGKMWVMAGADFSDAVNAYENESYSSTDGATWTQDTAFALPGFGSPQWPYPGPVVPFNNKWWYFPAGTGQVIHSSTDNGHTWTPTNIPFPLDRYTLATVFNGKIWLVKQDRQIWSSSDAITWTQATASAPLLADLTGFTGYNGKLWLVGAGPYGSGKVFSSSDNGVTWVQSYP